MLGREFTLNKVFVIHPFYKWERIGSERLNDCLQDYPTGNWWNWDFRKQGFRALWSQKPWSFSTLYCFLGREYNSSINVTYSCSGFTHTQLLLASKTPTSKAVNGCCWPWNLQSSQHWGMFPTSRYRETQTWHYYKYKLFRGRFSKLAI